VVVVVGTGIGCPKGGPAFAFAGLLRPDFGQISVFLWEDGKVQLCKIWDPVLGELVYIGPHRLGQSWLLTEGDQLLRGSGFNAARESLNEITARKSEGQDSR
jgi:hypothetical protein